MAGSKRLNAYRELLSRLMIMVETFGEDHPFTLRLADTMDDPWYALTAKERKILNEYVTNWPDIGDKVI